MAMNDLSRNQTEIGCDLLLKSGRTWIDEISGVLESLHLDASVSFAFDDGDDLILQNASNEGSVRLAARPWGIFVHFDRKFYVSHLEGGVINAITIVSETSSSGWHLLTDRLKLEEFNPFEFQRIGHSHTQRSLLEDGWVEMTAVQDRELARHYGFEFHSFESVPIYLDSVLPNCELARGSIRSTQDLFNSNRPLFWRYENLMRRRFVNSLMRFGNRCSTVLCICVNHRSYILRIPVDGWGYLADAAWPSHVTAPGGRVLLFVPDMPGALVADETQGTLVGCGCEIALQLTSLFQENLTVWGINE